ncbi:MAG: DUF2493 domain-containing protein [Patescibacteria group bacterium]|nr:DUF2493 domain-containing protein [Patescibacteria group bacterium]
MNKIVHISKMRVVVAGSRDLVDQSIVERAIQDSGFEITELLSGACPMGVDAAAEKWAKANGIRIVRFPANWGKYGKAAGPIRNALMADIAEAGIVIMKFGGTPGSMNMIRELQSKNVKNVYIKLV